MAYTTINKSSDHFNTVAWTGTSSSPVNVTGYGFQPDMIWNKYRAGAGDHQLYDAVRTATKMIIPNSTAAESTNANGVTAFISDGFTAGSDINVNGGNSVAWGWKAGNSSGSSNTDGDITSTVSANTTAGFSIVKWTANLSSAVTVGHGLGTTPKVIIQKAIDQTSGWIVGGFGLDWSGYLTLSATSAFNNDSNDSSGTGRFFSAGGTEPSSTVFSTNSSALVGSATDVIAYCFAEKTGFSKFGSYVGNDNADGTFIYTGFKPAWVLFKRSSAAENWSLYDNKRLGYNPQSYGLRPNTNLVESQYGSTDSVDFVSNGFKIREGGTNINSGTYIYMAFAEAPLVGSNNVPCTAR